MKELAKRGEKWARKNGRSPYPVMATPDIAALPVADLAAKDCALFLWATYPKLKDAFEVMEGWGFEYKTVAFTWVKVNPSGVGFHFGLGYWCLSGRTKVYICHNVLGYVEHVTISELHKRNTRDYLIHTHKSWRRINSVWETGICKTVKVNHRLGETWCSPNHRWANKRLSTPRNPDGSRRREHIIEYTPIEDTEAMSRKSIYASGNASVNLIYSTTPIESLRPVRECDDFTLDYSAGWLIGLYAAEGHYGKDSHKNQVRFTIHSDETKMTNRVDEIVKQWDLSQDRYSNYKVKVHKHFAKDSNTQYLYFASKKVKALIKNFVQGSNARSKHLNLNALLQTTIEFRQGFVAGLLAGDGTKNKEARPDYRGYTRLVSASQKLIFDCQHVFHTLGIMTVMDSPTMRGSSSGGPHTAAYGLRFVSPRNKKLILDGVPVIPIRYDGLESALYEPLYDMSVEGETFVADNMVSHNTRQNPELVLLGTRGKPKRINNSVPNLVIYPRGRHSRKPDEIHYRIEKLMGDLPRVELFARRSQPGWVTIGNEIDGQDISDGLRLVAKEAMPAPTQFLQPSPTQPIQRRNDNTQATFDLSK